MSKLKKIAAFKLILQRGYMWCQLPTLALMGAGILTPYIQIYFDIHMWQVSLIALGIFLLVGFIDKKIGMLDADMSYATEANSTLMNGLRGKLNADNTKE